MIMRRLWELRFWRKWRIWRKLSKWQKVAQVPAKIQTRWQKAPMRAAIMTKMANLAKIVNIADICQNSHDTAKGFFHRRKCGIWRKFAKVLLTSKWYSSPGLSDGEAPQRTCSQANSMLALTTNVVPEVKRLFRSWWRGSTSSSQVMNPWTGNLKNSFCENDMHCFVIRRCFGRWYLQKV